jgi:hypothetical protein
MYNYKPKKKVKFKYQPNTRLDVISEETRETPENFINVKSDYMPDTPDTQSIPGSTDINSLDDPVHDNLYINQDNIYVDPFKPLFLSGTPNPEPKKIRKFDMSLLEFLNNISNSYIDIINDLVSNNFTDLSDLFLKNDRGIAIAVFFIVISIFFTFFIPFET